MEVAILGQRTLKVKAKNATLIVNPEKKVEEEIIVLTTPPNDYSSYSEKVVISGPGEYEVSGISIKAETSEKGSSFDFFDDGQRLVVLSSAGLAESKDIEDANAVVAYLDGESSGDIAKIASDVVAVVGEEKDLPVDHSNIKKTDKLNLKKTEEYKGFIVHLSK